MRRFDSWLVGLYLTRQGFLESVLFLTGQANSVEHQLFTAAERQVNIWAQHTWQRDHWPPDPRDWARLDQHARQVEVQRVAKVIAHAFSRRRRRGVDADALSALKAKLKDSTLRGAVLASPEVGLKALLQLQEALEVHNGDWQAAATQHKDLLCDALAQASNRAKMEDAIVELALFHAPEAAKVDTFVSAHNKLFGLRGLLLGEQAKPLKGQVYHNASLPSPAGLRSMGRPTTQVGKVFQDHILGRHTALMAQVGAGTQQLDAIASSLTWLADQTSLDAIITRVGSTSHLN